MQDAESFRAGEDAHIPQTVERVAKSRTILKNRVALNFAGAVPSLQREEARAEPIVKRSDDLLEVSLRLRMGMNVLQIDDGAVGSRRIRRP